jgi:PPOX class probable F420-dependent enzyme
MHPSDGSFDFRGLAGQVTEMPFAPDSLSLQILKKLAHDRYAWLTTLASNGIPVPMLVWFRFDSSSLTVYSQPRSSRVTHVLEHPQVSLHLESDGFGSGLVIIGGTATVTAEGVDPRNDSQFWAKYHVEAQALGLTESIASFSTRITIQPTRLWTTLPA